MEEDRIHISVGVTANIGNFSSIKVDTGLSKSYSSDEEKEKLKVELMEEVIELAQLALDTAVEAIELP